MMDTRPFLNFLFTVSVVSFFCILSVPAQNDMAVLQKIANANNEFSMKLHQTLARNSLQNLIFSPTSLFFALGMLYNGARGKTAQDLGNFLGYKEAGLSDEEVTTNLIQILTESSSSKNYTLKSVNAILVDRQVNLKPEYRQDIQEFFHAKIREIDFNRGGNQVVREINAWISDQTNGKISHFLDHLDSSTVLTILNAIYFKGLWSVPFDARDTRRERFYNYGKIEYSKSVPMMHKSHRILYTSSPDWEMIELPYKGDRISMVIVLPKQLEGLAAVENSLTPEQMQEYRNKMRSSIVNLTLPRFKIDFVLKNLRQDLEDLGVGNMFQYDADFSGISDTVPVRVSEVMHKAVVEVNEEGTVAAAATGVQLVPLSLSITREFKVDHPFYFAIVGKTTNFILFSGRVISL